MKAQEVNKKYRPYAVKDAVARVTESLGAGKVEKDAVPEGDVGGEEWYEPEAVKPSNAISNYIKY